METRYNAAARTGIERGANTSGLLTAEASTAHIQQPNTFVTGAGGTRLPWLARRVLYGAALRQACAAPRARASHGL